MAARIIILVFLLATGGLSAQEFIYKSNVASLLNLKEELIQKRKEKEKRIARYLDAKPSKSRSFERDGHALSIIDVRDGQPVYYITHNDGSVRSCGVYELRPGGRFGLDLAGENATIAVWDRGLPLASHVEFQGRLLNSDAASEFSFHSTHVTGTILAAGLNPAAKGFCPRASARAFDWFQDTEEMIEQVIANNLMVSNHSYGVPGGWNGNTWLGDPGISMTEDYRFGFYDAEAAAFDNIAFDAPYYSIVVSAGNERGDSGDGTIPADGPYDCITGFSTAKNVFTIGAVNKLNEAYSGAEDVVMSSFSSWGPVDDGRIKPDLCAPGVNLFSASNGSNQSYGNSSGTSMASPSAAGVIALTNEAYFTYNNRYLSSASLKALMIHTAHEAGENPGPDYSFGWGLINADKAVEFIQNEDGLSRRIIEASLLEGESYELELNPVQGKKISATLAWTDRAGPVPERALDPTDLMLVNDLDMRIEDQSGNQSLPWILDPASPSLPAMRGDNFRDNVEKIEFDNPDARPYTLRITHKGQLQGGAQDFSLIIEYESENEGTKNLYWVNGSGSWSDQSSWANSSGGMATGDVPQPNNKIIIDDNSISEEGDVLTMDDDYAVSGLVAFTEKAFILDLGGHTLRISGTTLFASEKFTIRNGVLLFANAASESNTLKFDQTHFENVSMDIGNNVEQSEWILEDSDFSVSIFQISGPGNYIMRNVTLGGGQIGVGDRLTLDNVIFRPETRFRFYNLTDLTELSTNRIELNDVNDVELLLLNVENNLEIIAENATGNIYALAPLNRIELNNAELECKSDLRVDELVIKDASALYLDPGVLLSCVSLALQPATNRIHLSGMDALNTSAFDISVRGKYCFDNLDIENLDLVGESAVSVGNNSTLSNSVGWFEGLCEDLLFAEYKADYLCEGALSEFRDISDGDVQKRHWTVNGDEAWGDEIMEYVFDSPGVYQVGLTIEDGQGNSNTWIDAVSVEESDIEPNMIIQNATQLASLKLADTYQWYNYARKLDGETSRVYAYNGAPGIYWVLTFVDGCNRRSEILDLGTRVIDLDKEANDLLRINNPVHSVMNIQWLKPSHYSIRLLDPSGKHITSLRTEPGDYISSIPLNNCGAGMYIMLIQENNNYYVKTIIVQP